MIYNLSTKRRKMNSREYLDTAAKIVTGQRQHDYGDKYQNHENIAKLWSAYLDYDTISAHDVAICMLLLKVARLKTQTYNRLLHRHGGICSDCG